MPKMTHWNSPDTIDVSAEKAAVYAAQGWQTVSAKPAKVQPAIVREDAEPAPAKKTAAKKTAAKKTTKK